MWIEVDSLYAGFYAQGRNTNCPSEAKWEEMIGGTWVTRHTLFAYFSIFTIDLFAE